MKKFLTICMLALSCLLFASCDGGKPEFKFSLNLTGEVANAPTAIAGNFIVDVANDAPEVFLFENATVNSIECDAEANDWLNDYIEKNVISRFEENPETIYDFYVKGYVKELKTGLNFSVDKRFTNRE